MSSGASMQCPGRAESRSASVWSPGILLLLVWCAKVVYWRIIRGCKRETVRKDEKAKGRENEYEKLACEIYPFLGFADTSTMDCGCEQRSNLKLSGFSRCSSHSTWISRPSCTIPDTKLAAEDGLAPTLKCRKQVFLGEISPRLQNRYQDCVITPYHHTS